MARLAGTGVSAPLVTPDDRDTHPTHLAKYGQGGYRSVKTLAERNAIPAERREDGMVVRVTADPVAANNRPWKLLADLVTWEDDSNNTQLAAAEAQAAADAAALAEQKRSDAASAANQAALDAATANAQRAAAELARALAEAAQTNTEQVVGTVRGKTSRSGVPLALTDDVGFWIAYFTALGDFVAAGGKLNADGSLDTGLFRMLSLADGSLRLKDAAGFVRFLVDATGGLFAPGISVTPDGLIRAGSTLFDPAGVLALGPHSLGADGSLNLPQIAVLPTTSAGFRIRDPAGFVAWQVDTTGLASGSSGGSSSTGFTATEIIERDARARAASAEPSRSYVGSIAPLTAQIIHFLVYGQSLSCGYEGHPRITKAQPYDNLMLGLSVHYGNSATQWPPIGDNTFHDLVATVVGDSGVMSDTDVAALAWQDDNRGETVGETALSFLRRAFLDGLGITATTSSPYTARRFLCSEAGSGGQTIEVLSPGNDPTRYPRIVDCATRAKAAATAAGLSYGIGAYLWLQGEANANSADAANTAAAYKAKLATLKAALHTDIAVGIAGQDRPAAFFTYQTGGTYISATYGVGVAQGQWEFAEENEDTVMVGPVYPMPDKYGHLSANGYRWMGEYFGKAMRETLLLRRKFRPLCPIRASYRSSEILIEFNVPRPPLQWGKPWLMTTGAGPSMVAMDFDNKGFVVEDDAGLMTAVTPVLAGDCCVKLTLPRAISSAAQKPVIRYGTNATRGSGCLMDSDPTLSHGLYTYDPDSGAKDADNIPELNGRRYPLNNWCVIFEITATPA